MYHGNRTKRAKLRTVQVACKRSTFPILDKKGQKLLVIQYPTVCTTILYVPVLHNTLLLLQIASKHLQTTTIAVT